MPPKRKATGGAAKAGGKKAKVEDEGPATMKDAIDKLRTVDTGKKKVFKADQFLPAYLKDHGTVVDDYDCMLNQTNIGQNNNKYYVIQVLEYSGKYYCWNRWGRVGESGANALHGPTTKENATKNFEKKFRDKSKNKWEDRASFKPIPGKYTLLEMAGEDEEDEVDAGPSVVAPSGPTSACSLDKPTQDLIKLIFDNDMFKDAMKKFDIDVKKMPLGKLSKAQIAKGFDCLDEIELDIKSGKTANLNTLSSKFYTLIPHDFGRKVPPPIRDLETVRQKMDMLLVLGDIEFAQSLQKDKGKGGTNHPLDVNYGLLKCDLDLLDAKSKEFKIIEKYTKSTGYPKILNVWKVCRDGESSRFKVHDAIQNRKLLWHGTNVAVVTAILKSGLRIMPHSGGRVGRGIYFASENSKSAGYVGRCGNKGIMFLNEVALGKEWSTKVGGGHLVTAPAGYDSIVARGRREPDPAFDTSLMLDGKKVTVPQGSPIMVSEWNDSNFSQSEYLVYKESQNRIRYLLFMEF